jgi:hypothetical protein
MLGVTESDGIFTIEGTLSGLPEIGGASPGGFSSTLAGSRSALAVDAPGLIKLLVIGVLAAWIGSALFGGHRGR